jgi:hypothetical protein
VRVHAPYATRYPWSYLHEALEVDATNPVELLFTPCIDQDIHALFLTQIGQSDSEALHVVIADQAGFPLRPNDPRVPANVRLISLPPDSPELNPVEKLGDLVKDAVCNRLFPSLCGRWSAASRPRSSRGGPPRHSSPSSSARAGSGNK